MDSLRKMCAQRAARLSPDALEAGISRIAIDEFTMSAIEEFIKTEEARETELTERLDALYVRVQALRNFHSPEFQVCQEITENLVILGVAWKPCHHAAVASLKEEIWHKQRSLRMTWLIRCIEDARRWPYETDEFHGLMANSAVEWGTEFLGNYPRDAGSMLGQQLRRELELLEDQLPCILCKQC